MTTLERVDKRWRARTSRRRVASEEEVDAIVARLLVHVKRGGQMTSMAVPGSSRPCYGGATTAEDEVAGYLRENALEYDDGHGAYRFWLFGKHYSSVYQLARHFAPGLSARRGGGGDDPSKRTRGTEEEETDGDRKEGNEGDMLRTMRRMQEEMEVLRKRAADAEARLKQRERRPNKRRRLDPDLDARPQAPPRIPSTVSSSSSATGEGGEEQEDPGLFEDTDPPPASRPATTMLRLPVVSSELTLDDVNAVFDRRVANLGGMTSLRDLCNFDPEIVLEMFTHRGAAFATAMEQSQKSHLLVALAALASMKRRPCVLVVGQPHASTSELEVKMRDTLESMGIATSFLSNAQGGWNKLKADPARMAEFHSGHRVLVTPGYAMARTSLIEEVDARDVLVLLDESDVVFARDSWAPGTKEADFARLIGRPQEDGARVTGVVLVSATHIADYHLWRKAMPDVPKLFGSVDLELLRRRGFTTHHEMDLMDTVTREDAQKHTQYGLRTRGFRRLMEDFKTCGGTKKLMLVASCPRVNVGEATLFTQGEEVQRMDPEALVVVHYSGRCFFRVRNKWEEMKTWNRSGATETARKPRRVKAIGTAFKLLQQRYCRRQGRDRRFVGVGYNALARSMSARTGDMVPTHMFALLGKGRHSADVRQTLMRPAGRSTGVRVANGHGNVKVVTPEEDWELVTALYGFQESIAEEMASNPDFDFESHRHYDISAAPVVRSRRKHVRPKMRLADNWKVNATPEEVRRYEDERNRKRREREERFRCTDTSSASASAPLEEEDEEEDKDVENAEDVVEDEEDPAVADGEDLPLERREGASRRRRHPGPSEGRNAGAIVPFSISLSSEDATSIGGAWANNVRSGVARMKTLATNDTRFADLVEHGFVHCASMKVDSESPAATVQHVDGVIRSMLTGKKMMPYGVKADDRRPAKYMSVVVDLRVARRVMYVMACDASDEAT